MTLIGPLRSVLLALPLLELVVLELVLLVTPVAGSTRSQDYPAGPTQRAEAILGGGATDRNHSWDNRPPCETQLWTTVWTTRLGTSPFP